MTLYGALKHAHITAVVVSGLLFSYRFYRLQRYPQRSLGSLLKWLPHVNDTLLLGAGVGMLLVIGINPLRLDWLSVKLVLLPVYIVLGALCLRALPGSIRQMVFFLLAILVYMAVVMTAISKNAFMAG